MRIGMVGCGVISEWHLKTWRQLAPEAEVVACADIKFERAQRRAEEFAIAHAYATHQEMFDKESLDIVDITAPETAHLPIVQEAAARGLHVLCQKPFASTLEEGRTMVECCERAGVSLMVHHNFRWQPRFRKIKELIAQGAVGRPYWAHILMRWNYVVPDGEGRTGLMEIQPFFADYPRLNLFVEGIHFLDLLRGWFGNPTSVSALTRHVSPIVQGDVFFTVTVEFADVVAQVEDSWLTFGPGIFGQTTVAGTEGTLLDSEGGLVCYRSGGAVERIPVNEGQSFLDGFIGVQRHFLDCLRRGSEPETSGRDNLQTLALVFAAYESADRREVVRLETGR